MSNKMMTLKEFFEAHKQLKSDEVILDVRRPEEHAEAHIAGSKNISHENVATAAAELGKYKTVYIHCKRGGRAKAAFESLTQAGLTNLVCVHDAGMDAWMENGWPVVRS